MPRSRRQRAWSSSSVATPSASTAAAPSFGSPRRRRAATSRSTTMTNTRRPRSAYGQVRIGLGSRLTMTPGSRVDHWTLTGSTTASPWINGEFRLSERTRLRGGTGIYRQFPDLDEVHGIHGGGDELRPERALHVDAGIEQTLPRQTRLLFNVYMREERDVLWAPGAEPQRLSNGTIQPGAFNAPWVNALSGDARGAEVVVRRDATDGFSGWAGYAFSRLRYTDTQTGESFWGDADQRHTLSLYGNYRLSSRTSISARYRYGSNYPMRGYIGEPVGGPGPAANGGRPPAVLRARAGAQHIAAAGLLAPGHPRRSRVHLVGPPARRVRRRRERPESRRIFATPATPSIARVECSRRPSRSCPSCPRAVSSSSSDRRLTRSAAQLDTSALEDLTIR